MSCICYSLGLLCAGLELNMLKIQLIRLPALIKLTGISKSGIYARMNRTSPYWDPTFPRPIKLSSGPRGASAWALLEVENWVTSRLENREVY